jgi:hypothetical protein
MLNSRMRTLHRQHSATKHAQRVPASEPCCSGRRVVACQVAEVAAASTRTKLPATHLESSRAALEQLRAAANGANRECPHPLAATPARPGSGGRPGP